jgi:hypothetical protein
MCEPDCGLSVQPGGVRDGGAEGTLRLYHGVDSLSVERALNVRGALKKKAKSDLEWVAMNMHGDPKRYRVLVLVRVTRLNGHRDVLRPGVICAAALPAADRVTFEGRGDYIDLVAGELERLIGSRKIVHLLG